MASPRSLACSSSKDAEQQRLIPEGSVKRTYSYLCPRTLEEQLHSTKEEAAQYRSSNFLGIEFASVSKVDNMTYSARSLSAWHSLFVDGTVWSNRSLWVSQAWVMLVALVVGLIAYVWVKDPASLKVGKFNQLAAFLNVFVGLLLGFFLTSSMNRWYACAEGFLALFDAIRNMQMEFHALGVTEESESQVIRHGVLSAHLMRLELHRSVLRSSCQRAFLEEEFQNILRERPGLVAPREEQFLKKMLIKEDGQPSAAVWTWVASRIGRMAQNGEIPAMQTPTFVRIMGMVQAAHQGLRTVRGAIVVQAPFVYVHMLSTLVHLNNFINALSFGLVTGVTFGTFSQGGVASPLPGVEGSPLPAVEEYKKSARASEMAVDAQNLIISFAFSVFGPFIYHALLEVAICLAQPFDHEQGHIPVKRMTRNLERDLCDGKLFSGSLPSWNQPSFAGSK